MSCYAEYLHADSEERREEAWQDCLAEARRDAYYDSLPDYYEDEEAEDLE